MKLPVALTHIEGSSNLHAVGYHAEERHLYVQFTDGGAVYRYLEVEEGAWALMQASESKGRFLAKCIKPNHEVEKLPTDSEK
jgi:hypothetical protein